MQHYFISSLEEPDLKINHKSLTERLLVQQPDADVHLVDNPASNYSLEWRKLQIKEMELEGSLDKKGQAVVLYGHEIDCAIFAVWFRSQVPDEYKLAFYDEGYSACVELEKETTVEQLIEPFLAE